MTDLWIFSDRHLNMVVVFIQIKFDFFCSTPDTDGWCAQSLAVQFLIFVYNVTKSLISRMFRYYSWMKKTNILNLSILYVKKVSFLVDTKWHWVKKVFAFLNINMIVLSEFLVIKNLHILCMLKLWLLIIIFNIITNDLQSHR